MTIVYKVVRKCGEKLVSVAADEPPYMLIYSTDEWTYPTLGRILAFDTWQAAVFFRVQYMHQVWVAKADDPQPVGRLAHWYDTDIFASLWEDNKWQEFLPNRISFTPWDVPPVGTVACTRLKLLEQVLEEPIP